MAHTFQIIDYTSTGGTVTLFDFNTTNRGIIAFNPGFDTNPNAEMITDVANVWIKATSDSGLSQTIRDLDAAFEIANKRWESGSGKSIYLKYAPDGCDAGISPLRKGSIVAIDNVLDSNWANLELNLTVNLTRKNYWEANRPVGSTAYVIGYATNGNTVASQTAYVYNCNDGTGNDTSNTVRNNWFSMTSTAFVFDLPSELLSMQIQIGSTGSSLSGVYVCQFYEDAQLMSSTDYPTKKGWFEGEDASTAASSTGAAYSGAAYQAFTISTGTTGTNIEWNCSTHFNANFNRIMCGAKFNGTISIKPYYRIGTNYHYGPTTIAVGTNTWKSYDLGIMHVPPVGFLQSAIIAYASPYLGINVIKSGGITFNIDWLQAIPIDSFMYVETGDYSTSSDKDFYIVKESDGYYAYFVDSGANVTGITKVLGKLEIKQQKKNYIFFKFIDKDGLDIPHNKFMVNVNFNKRWRYFHAS